MRTKTKFKVGDRVRRIDIGNEHDSYHRIKYDKTYTVQKIIIYDSIPDSMDIVYLDGFHTGEACWAKRFVKVSK